MGRRRNLMTMMITTVFAMMVWLLLLILCNASRTDRIYVTPARDQIMLVDREIANISPNSYGDLLRYSRLGGNIFRFFKTNCNMKLMWSSITTMEQHDGVSSSTSLNQELLSRRILRRKSPPTSYPPPGANPSVRTSPAPSPGPIAYY